MIAIDTVDDLTRWAALSRDGDEEAQRQLVGAMEGTVRATARRAVKNPEDAEDLVQNIFLAVFRGLGTFRGESHFRTWLTVVARNEARKFLRTRQRRDDPVRDAERDLEKVPARSFSSRAQERRMAGALRGLASGDREALEKVVFHGLSYEQAGLALGCSAGAVRGRVYRARRELRRLLEAAGS